MDDNKAVLNPKAHPKPHDGTVLAQPNALIVKLYKGDDQLVSSYYFTHRFSAGRSAENDVEINSSVVSRRHLELKKEADGWWVYNLKSANGIFIDDKLVEHKSKIDFPVRIFFGRSDIFLKIQKADVKASREEKRERDIGKPAMSPPLKPEKKIPAVQAKKSLSEAEIKQRYLSEEEAEDAGDHTRFVRRLIIEDREVRGKSYKKIIWVVSVLFCLAIGLAAYQHVALGNSRSMAIDMFYDIKALEVSVARADVKLEESAAVLDRTMNTIVNEKLKIAQQQIKDEQDKILSEKMRMMQERKKMAGMKAKYQQYLEQTRSLQLSFPSAKQHEADLIAKVAREFGESELELPDDFVEEVSKYIHYWQTTPRLQATMDKIENNNQLNLTLSALEKAGLPLYFLYLPLQASNFDENAIGPQTRYGIAKGAWQLLAGTAQQYGITVGPLANSPEYDSKDQRFDFNLATLAATRYLKDLYGNEAQASGLLVLASYNMGENQLKEMIRNLPDNPREKNFWKLSQRYELPKEIHDYVFYIFSAAVIGEDPQHFGFKFMQPLVKAKVSSIQ